MKQSVNEHDFRRAFESIRPNNFSYEGLGLLFEYLEDLEQDIGDEYELDVIALCCDWSELTPDDLINDFAPDLDGYDDLADWLHNQTMVAGQTSDGSFVFLSF